MKDDKGLIGLNCPECGGMLAIPEGQVIVVCSFCGQRSIVTGERGVLRTQVAVQIDRKRAEWLWKNFITSSAAMDWTARFRGHLQDCFLVYMPFWQVNARVLAWLFGEVEVKKGDRVDKESREFKIAEDMSWNRASAEVGEFGVSSILLQDVAQMPFDSEKLHAQALVFEPVGSRQEALEAARESLAERIRKASEITDMDQEHIRFMEENLRLVYFPLWVVRYTFRKRTFQIVIDGFSGEVVYGKGPGSTLYRAFMLVSSAAVGAFLMVDIPALVLWFGFNFIDLGDDGIKFILGLVAASFLAGLALLRKGYQRFRYGEHFDHRPYENRTFKPVLVAEEGVTRLRIGGEV